MNSEIKNEVLSLVQLIEDENLLQLLKADIEFFKETGSDITDGLSKEDIEELRVLSNEPDDINTVTEDEYKQLTDKWRIT